MATGLGIFLATIAQSVAEGRASDADVASKHRTDIQKLARATHETERYMVLGITSRIGRRNQACAKLSLQIGAWLAARDAAHAHGVPA